MDQILLKVKNYCDLMDWARLKEGLKTAMSVSSDCNKFVTDNELWSPTVEPERRRVILAVLLNSIRILAALYTTLISDLNPLCLGSLQSFTSFSD